MGVLNMNKREIPLAFINTILEELRDGRMIILVDDEARENEGDLVIAAQHVTPEAINFMSRYGRGLICLPMLEEDFERLSIPMMVKHDNDSLYQSAFGVSIEAKEGVTTGISAHDRALTIQTAVDEKNTRKHIVMPGHVFPLKARQGGVLARIGHTEGSVDLARLAGLKPAAVICEIMNEDGTMARRSDLEIFAKRHQLKIASIRDLVTYRVQHETLIQEISTSHLSIDPQEKFVIKMFRSLTDGREHVALLSPHFNPETSALVRLHSECLTGDALGSLRCDCGRQLKMALNMIAAEKGALLYLRQEGRGIGLGNKIKAYALQEKGLDTVEANHHLGFAADMRDYCLAAQMLRALNIKHIRLLTNNPHKVTSMERYGIVVKERVPLETVPTADNIHYLQTKQKKLGHLLHVVQECDS